MSQPSPKNPLWRVLLALLSLGAIHQLSPWPGPQWAFMAFLVLGLAAGFKSPVVAMLWSAAAGWLLEGSLRMYPHMGGTALANMVLCLIAQWHFRNRPPEHRNSHWGQMAAFTLALALLVHALVRYAAGPHAWGWGWLWALVTVPLWGTLSMRLQSHAPRR